MWRYGQPESESLESVMRKNFRHESVLCDGSWASVEEPRAEGRRDLMSREGELESTSSMSVTEGLRVMIAERSRRRERAA